MTHSRGSSAEVCLAAALARVAQHVPGADAFAVALTTHVTGDIRAELLDVVKYATAVRSANRMHGSAESLRTGALPLWHAAMEGLEAPAEQVVLGRGNVWDLAVVVDAWLVGPVPRSELAAV